MPDFAAPVELQPAQALAADEHRGAVADDRADVQAQIGQLADLDAAAGPSPSLPMIRISTPARSAILRARAESGCR